MSTSRSITLFAVVLGLVGSALAPVGASSAGAGSAPADHWALGEAVAAAGDVDWAQAEAVVVSVSPDGEATRSVISGDEALARFAARWGDEAPALAPAGGQDGVVGHLLLHLFIDSACRVYDVAQLGGGLMRVSGSWDLGIHVALDPLTAAASGSPEALLLSGVDLAEAATAVHADGAAWAVGEMSVEYTVISLWGVCLLSFGDMMGDGAFLFDGAASAVPV